MGEHFFGLGRGRVSANAARKIRAVARDHGASFIATALPGEGPRYWFSCPNLGFPFDRATERAVRAALETAGLEPEKHVVRR